jgi:hypothetical protein
VSFRRGSALLGGLKTTALLAIVSITGACIGSGKDKVEFSKVSEAPRGTDDIAIVTTDGGITMAVRGDSIRLRFSDSLMKKINKDLDTSKVEDKGFGGDIARMVKKQVASSLGGEMSTPLGDIEDAKVENGTIVFVYADKSKKQPFGNTTSNDRPLLSSFSQADAEKFVAYVKAHPMNR